MSLLVAFAPDGRGRAVLHLATMLARSADDDLVVCAVVPAPWYPSPARVDAEYRDYLQQAAERALDGARGRLPADIPATFVVHHARSAPAGLLEVAEEHDASLIVVGSSSAGGVGHVTLGSASSRLLHSSPIPVAVAPRGFRSRPDARVARVTAAFGGSEGAESLVVAAAGVSAGVGAGLRLASFVVRARPPYTSGVGTEADEAMVAEWVKEIEAAGRAALEKVSDLPAVPRELEIVVGRGETWEEALEDVEWQEGDVLVVGSSSIGPVARVFLGSRATKIVQHSPVPVVVVPRGAVAELADEALHAESV
jgi:nucleotide-binding universal stress UspA family protein